MYVPNPASGPHFFLIPLNKYKGKVPFIITDIFQQLIASNSQEIEGILRTGGQHKDITNLCKELDKGHVADWNKYNPETITSAFKKYIENLSMFDPLIPETIEKDLISSVNNEDIKDDEIGERLHQLISSKYSNLLTHRSTLATIFHFFNKVIVANSEKNKMDSENISICSSMLFFTPKENYLGKEYLKLITILINKFDTIFEESWYSPSSNFVMTEDEIECIGAPLVSIELAQIECKRRNYRKDSLIPFYTYLNIEPPKREAPKLEES